MAEEDKSQQLQACEGQCKEETPKEERTKEALGGQRKEDVFEGQRKEEVSEERKEEAPKGQWKEKAPEGQQKEATPGRQRKWTRVREYVYRQLMDLTKDFPSDPDALTEEQHAALRVAADRLKNELLALQARCKKSS